MLAVVILSVSIPSIIILNVVMLSVVNQRAIILNVVVPVFSKLECCHAECRYSEFSYAKCR
jgi:hypothetical protein